MSYINLTKQGRELIEEINNHMRVAMSNCLLDHNDAVGRFKIGEKYIDIDYSHPNTKTSVSGFVYIIAPSEREYPRIEEYIAHHLPDWDELIEESEKAEAEEIEFQDYLWNNCRW